MPTWDQFLSWAFYGIVGTAAFMAASFLKTIKDSIVELNQKVALILKSAEFYEKKLDDHDRRIEKIEDRLTDWNHHD